VKRQQAAAEVRMYVERGRMLEGKEQYDAAIKEYQKALSIIAWYDETADFGVSAEGIRDRIDTARYKGEVAARSARAEQIAAAQAERERELAGERERRLGRIRGWFEGAHQAFRRGEYALAREYASQIQRLDPTNCDAERLIEMSHDAENAANLEEARWAFDDQWKAIMRDLESSALPQVGTVVFPSNWLDDIAHRKPRVVGEEAPAEEATNIAGILEIIDKKRVKGLAWEGQNLDQVVEYLRTITGLNFYITPKVRAEKFDDVTVSANLDDVSVRTILTEVVTGPNELSWEVRGGVVWIMMADEIAGSMRLQYFDVKDLAVEITNFMGQDINLVPSNFTPPEPPELPEPQSIFPLEQLVELIKETIGGEGKWEDPASLEAKNGILIARNTPEILAQVDDLLSQLRANTGLLVNLEIRFLTAEDNFLRDVGVDIRGLGDDSAGVGQPGLGTNVVQDDVFFGSAANPYGVPFGTNPEPSSVGTANDAGIFYNDGQDGAYSTRVENLWDTVVKRFGNPDSLTNSGGLSFQHTYLDDTEIEVILRAVEKSERVQQITAPRITVYNTQRANVSVLNQVAYVADYEVEIAQASNIANPVIQTIQDGVVLDVRPVVSADRRFVTLELRPTVAVLQRPIATFSTSLASGPIGANAPVILQIPELRKSTVRTTVSMPDSGTLLLGGLKFYEKDLRESGVPFLNNIPILSFLVTRKGNFVNRRNLLVLITARIVPLEELEPRDNLDIPELPPETIFTPIRTMPEAAPPCAPPKACGCPPKAACGCVPR
jgi:type II secretory pathway component GspD/PulD (secretin)